MSDEKNKGYRDRLNLAKTIFCMQANLVQREPRQLRPLHWRLSNV